MTLYGSQAAWVVVVAGGKGVTVPYPVANIIATVSEAEVSIANIVAIVRNIRVVSSICVDQFNAL